MTANSTYVQEKQTVSRALWMGFTENSGLHYTCYRKKWRKTDTKNKEQIIIMEYSNFKKR